MDSKLSFIDHIAIAIPAGSADAHVKLYETMGCTVIHRESVPAPHLVNETLLRIGESENLIQLLEPASDESPVAKQLEKNGGRAHVAHVAFRVPSAAGAHAELKEAGFNLTQDPGPGSRGTTIFFIHPKTTPEAALGVLFEVVEEPEAAH